MSSTITVDGLLVLLPSGAQGNYSITGGDPLLFEWKGPTGMLKIEGRDVYFNNTSIGDATDAKRVEIDEKGNISIIR